MTRIQLKSSDFQKSIVISIFLGHAAVFPGLCLKSDVGHSYRTQRSHAQPGHLPHEKTPTVYNKSHIVEGPITDFAWWPSDFKFHLCIFQKRYSAHHICRNFLLLCFACLTGSLLIVMITFSHFLLSQSKSPLL